MHRITARFSVFALMCGVACASLRAGDAVKVLATYEARISERDHLDRRGNPLKTPAAILRRDRESGAANGIGSLELEDNPCDFFQSAEHRNLMESLLEHGHITPATAKAILTGTPLIKVTLYGTTDGKASYLDVKFLQGGKPVVEESF